jgi:regulatory protein
MRPLSIGKDRALEKIKHFCAYQERSHRETREKLYGFGISRQEVEELMAHLVEENYLNEERFATAFAGGRFRMKQWGRNKIRFELQQRGISQYCIKEAIAAIPEADYRQTLQKLADAKFAALRKEKNKYVKLQKLQQFLIQKGYEPALVGSVSTGLFGNGS